MSTTQRMPEPDPPVDPARHLIGYLDFGKDAQGRAYQRPVTFDQAAATFRRMVQEGLPAEEHRRAAPGIVLLSQGRAFVIRMLVRELALRLQPGLAVGAIQSDGSLSEFIQELADDLGDRTWGDGG